MLEFINKLNQLITSINFLKIQDFIDYSYEEAVGLHYDYNKAKIDFA